MNANAREWKDGDSNALLVFLPIRVHSRLFAVPHLNSYPSVKVFTSGGRNLTEGNEENEEVAPKEQNGMKDQGLLSFSLSKKLGSFVTNLGRTNG